MLGNQIKMIKDQISFLQNQVRSFSNEFFFDFFRFSQQDQLVEQVQSLNNRIDEVLVAFHQK